MRFIDERQTLGPSGVLSPRVPGTPSFHLEVLVGKFDRGARRCIRARALEAAAGGRIRGIDAKRCPVIGDGALRVALTQINIAAGNEGPRQRRIEVERLAVVREGGLDRRAANGSPRDCGGPWHSSDPS